MDSSQTSTVLSQIFPLIVPVFPRISQISSVAFRAPIKAGQSFSRWFGSVFASPHLSLPTFGVFPELFLNCSSFPWDNPNFPQDYLEISCYPLDPLWAGRRFSNPKHTLGSSQSYPRIIPVFPGILSIFPHIYPEFSL